MSGRLQIAATGVQDVWLTGEPQFSYFLLQFKRHTKFAIDYVDVQYDKSELDFGKTFNFRIPSDKGDAIRNITLKVTLGDPSTGYEWTPSIMSNMIESAELLIGGQMIEKITGEYIYMHQQSNNSEDDVRQTVYFLTGHGFSLRFTDEYTYYVDLPFYFYRFPNLSIPTCALTKQNVEVRVKFKSLEHLVLGNNPSQAVAEIKRLSLNTEFIFLSEPERNFLKTRPLDYVITQLQMSSFVMEAGYNTKSVMLNFSHPVKELYFISESDEGYNTTGNISGVATGVVSEHPYNMIDRISLSFNGHVVFDEDHLFMGYNQFYRYDVNQPTSGTSSSFYKYTFSLNPASPNPTGQVNMSRIIHKLLTATIIPKNTTVNNTMRIYAVNYNILRISGGLCGLKF